MFQNSSAKIYFEKIYIIVYNTVYFRLCINLMHITPPVTAEGYDGSHHPRYAKCRGIWWLPSPEVCKMPRDMMAPITRGMQNAEGYDGSHPPRYAECDPKLRFLLFPRSYSKKNSILSVIFECSPVNAFILNSSTFLLSAKELSTQLVLIFKRIILMTPDIFG